MDAFAVGRGSQQWQTDIDYCQPQGVTFGQVGDIVKDYLEKHRNDRHKNAATLTIYALSEAFPCSD